MNADGGEQQRNRREQAEQQHREPSLSDRARKGDLHRLDPEYRKPAIDVMDRRRHRSTERRGITRRPNQQYPGAIRGRSLRQRRVSRDRGCFSQSVKLLVGNDADNRARRTPEAHTGAERFAIGEEAPRRGRVDERAAAPSCVAVANTLL